MKPDSAQYKRFLFGLLLAALMLPMVQSYLHFRDADPLKGYTVKQSKPSFSRKGWESGEFQKAMEKYADDSAGFHNFFIRMYNQVTFSLFRETGSEVIIGKEDYLYEQAYINAYLGWDYCGESVIRENCRKIRIVQDSLESKGIHFIILLAPGKGSFFPEFIPDRYLRHKRSPTNYETYVAKFRKMGIRYFDCHEWFRGMKGKSRYPLYPRYGVHWSQYGAQLVADSLVSLFRKISGIPLPASHWEGVVTPDTTQHSDFDAGESLNLLYPPDRKGMAYPIVRYDKIPDEKKENMLAIGDSYYWPLIGTGMSSSVFNDTYWYYNQQVYSKTVMGTVSVSELDFRAELEKQRFVVLITTDANLKKFPFGFIDRAYEVYQRNVTKENPKIRKYLNDIRSNGPWLKEVMKKAIQTQRTLEEQMMLEAIWMVEHEK